MAQESAKVSGPCSRDFKLPDRAFVLSLRPARDEEDRFLHRPMELEKWARSGSTGGPVPTGEFRLVIGLSNDGFLF
jgi:hypothetical protein